MSAVGGCVVPYGHPKLCCFPQKASMDSIGNGESLMRSEDTIHVYQLIDWDKYLINHPCTQTE